MLLQYGHTYSTGTVPVTGTGTEYLVVLLASFFVSFQFLISYLEVPTR